MSGGSAMYHGANYQAAVGAFFATLALAENTNLIPPDIPQAAPPVRVGAEQGWPVDDLAVWLGATSMVWIQAKASLDASGLPDVFGQIVRNVAHGRERVAGSPLQTDDRLLLAVGDAPAWIETDLRELLVRIGHLAPEDDLAAAFHGPGPVNEAYDRVAPMIRAALQAEGQQNDDTAVRRVLTSARVWPINEDELQRATVGLLDQYVLEDGGQANVALALLRQHFAQAAQHRTIHDVRELRALLSTAGLRLRAPRSFASDVTVLVDLSDRTIATETAARALRSREGNVHIERAVTAEVLRALTHGNIAVTGEAGAGKSGVLLDCAARLRSAGERVVFIDATDPTMRDPRAALGLTHRLDDVLDGWNDPNRPSFLFIDGFDATRLGESFASLLRVVRELQARGANWRVAIATREYDLLYAPDLRDLLPYDAEQNVPEEFRDADRFDRVAHIFVRGMDDTELASIGQSSPSLGMLISAAPAEVQRLLRNPFNLSVAASLTIDSAAVPDLSGVHSRVDLMDLWWERRLQRGANALQKEQLLKTVSERMIAEQQLRVSIDVLRGDAAAAELFSDAVLVALGRRQRQLAFGHAIIFDYVVDRLLLGAEGAMATMLGEDRDTFLFVLPSIRMRFAELWQDDRAMFYRELATLFAEGNQRRTLLMVAASIPVEHLERADDLVQLLDADDAASLAAVRFVVRTLIYEREQGRSVVGDSAQPWAEVVLEMARRLPRHEHDCLLLLIELLRTPDATPAQFGAIGEAARICLAQQLDRDPYEPRLVRMAIEAFAKSYDADSEAARPLLERILEPARIARVGQFEIEPLASHTNRMRDASALEAIYAGVIADVSVPEGQIAIGNPSVIMGLVQDARQTLSHARWALGQRFAAFLSDDPRAATRAFCRVINREADQPRASRQFDVPFRGRDLHLLLDSSNVWDCNTYVHDDWHVMSVAFETRLRDGVRAGDEFFETALDEIVEHGHALYLWRLLIRTAGASEASALALATFVAQRAVLLTRELGEPIADYLAGAYACLPLETREVIDAALLSVIDDESNGDLVEYRRQRVSEYAASIPAGQIMTARLAELAVRDEAVTPEDAAYRRRMTLSGSATSPVMLTRTMVSEAAEAAGASPELIAAIDAAQPLIDAGSNVSATREPNAVAPAVRRIDELSRDAAPAIRNEALDVIAALVRVGLEWHTFGREERSEFLPLLLEAVMVQEAPEDGEQREASDRADGHISWGSPNSVADGIQALWRMYQHGHDDRIVAAIQRLSRHPRSNMRYLAIREAGLLRDFDSEVVWGIAERAAADPAVAVVAAGVGAANMVAHLDFNRLRRIMYSTYDRFVITNPKNDLARSVLKWAVRRLLMGDTEASARLDPILTQPWAHADVAETVIVDIADVLAPTGSIEERASASAVLASLVERMLAHVAELAERHGYNVDTYPEPAKTEATASIRLLSEAAERVYYESGVMQRPQANGPFEDTGTIDAENLRLLRVVLEPLARFRFSRTAYYVVKTLQGAIETDPRGVLSLAVEAIQNGVSGGLASDMMAEDDIRDFVVRYIDGHRGLLESDRACLAGVMDIVDSFVDAGWPQWIDVIFKLDNIYRGD
jgi:hypothetical protein